MSRTERLLADVERGFTALEDGRLDDVLSILERCRRIDRKHPDVLTLAAAVAETRGELDEAIGCYRQLSEVHKDDPMPRICIARLQLDGHLDPDAALDTLEAAFDFIDEEDDLIEAIYVRTRALVERGDLDEARTSLAELATSVIDDPDLALDLAEVALTAEDAPAAQRWIETARAANGKADRGDDERAGFEAEALHLLGLVHEAAGDRPAMIAAWQEVLRLDRAAPAGELAVTDDQLEQIAVEALDELPDEIHARLANVPILIHDLPSEDLVADGFDPRLLGLFQGTPMPEDGTALPAVTNILLFKRNLERFAADEEDLADQIAITVLHETAHYFGLDEDDLEKLGLD